MKLRIFVIDDEESIRDSFKWHLEEQGHEVMTAEVPALCAVFQGHDCEKDYPCGHALFIDYFFSETNAFDFIEKMEERGCRGMMRNKFVMSGDTTAINTDKALRLGCQVIQKPLDLGRLDELVSDVASRFPSGDRVSELQT